MKRGRKKKKNKLKPHCVSLKNGFSSIIFDKCWFDTFPNKDQVYESKPNISIDYILNVHGKNSMVEGKVYSMSQFQMVAKVFSND